MQWSSPDVVDEKPLVLEIYQCFEKEKEDPQSSLHRSLSNKQNKKQKTNTKQKRKVRQLSESNCKKTNDTAEVTKNK